MPAIKLVEESVGPVGIPVVVGAFSRNGAGSKADPELDASGESIDRALGGRLTAALLAAGGSGRAEEITKIPTLGLASFPLVVVAGLGSRDTPLEAEPVRRAVGAALRALGGHSRVHVALGGDSLAGAVAEGALLGSYRFTQYKSGQQPATVSRVDIAVTSPRDAAVRKAVRRAETVATAMNLVRDLVNTPPNDLYPASFAERARVEAEAAGVAVEILDERSLRRGKFGGILAVGAGSVRPPRLVRLTYRPARPKARVALVGKGITFDSGGLNIKTANMSWMKSDMGGAAAVIATTIAAARLRLPVEVTATVPMAENLPSGSSYRPSDILTLRGGRTVEVADTDAEGRLVLADAIVRAGEDEPDYLIEISTLTGAQLVALGTRVIGAMGQDEFRDRVVANANAAGESAWSMPLPPDLRRAIDSPIADIVNVAAERWGSMLVGGQFLSDFVPKGLPWVHLDIAGPAWNLGGPRDYTPKGGTGAGVRAILATLEDLARA